MSKQDAITVLRQTSGTLEALKHLQNSTVENMLNIGDQATIQLKSLNIALDVAYRNRDMLVFGQAAIDLVNAMQQAVECNYEIIKCITIHADNTKLAMEVLRKELGEVENG
jgi:3-hydroxyisobutyrate dehydrogenase-like beta-hydroxyacid dehydrogenase